MNPQLIDFKIFHKLEASKIIEHCSGNNEKGIFLLYPEKEAAQLPFLQKILAAAKLMLEKDVLLLAGTPSTTFSLSDFREVQQIHQVIVFGYPPQQIGLQIQIPKYQAHLINGCEYLFVDNLEQIATNDGLKRQLWGALQGMFLKKKED